MLSHRQYRFAIEYCVDYVATKAYIRAGYSEIGAEQGSSRLLGNVEVKAAIESHKRDLAGAARVTAAFISEKLRQIADSDRSCCCRYCWGIDHQYQWTEREYSRELDAALAAGVAVPELQGGFGYFKNCDPHPGCPRCAGEGIGPARPPAQDKDRLKALDLLQKQSGLQIERREVSGPGGGPIDLNALSDAELFALWQKEKEANALGKGTIEGTYVEVTPNSIEVNQLEDGSSP